MVSNWVFILVGNNATGKTTFQKMVAKHLCGFEIKRLDTNLVYQVVNPSVPEKLKSIFFISRSYQEKANVYSSIEDYFNNHFKKADICFLSSHLIEDDIRQMINECHKLFYNVGGVFWRNSCEQNPEINRKISMLNWDERFVIDNQYLPGKDKEEYEKIIDSLTKEFVQMLVNRCMGM